MISIKGIVIVFVVVFVLIMLCAFLYYMKHRNDQLPNIDTKLTNSGSPIADGLGYIKIICR